MTDDDVCPDCGRPYVKMTHHSVNDQTENTVEEISEKIDSEMTTVAHSIDRSGALPEVDDFCIIEGDER